jgi:hypothetical protein
VRKIESWLLLKKLSLGKASRHIWLVKAVPVSGTDILILTVDNRITWGDPTQDLWQSGTVSGLPPTAEVIHCQEHLTDIQLSYTKCTFSAPYSVSNRQRVIPRSSLTLKKASGLGYLATRWTIRGSSPGEGRDFPDRPWGPPNL